MEQDFIMARLWSGAIAQWVVTDPEHGTPLALVQFSDADLRHQHTYVSLIPHPSISKSLTMCASLLSAAMPRLTRSFPFRRCLLPVVNSPESTLYVLQSEGWTLEGVLEQDVSAGNGLFLDTAILALDLNALGN